MRSLLLVPLAAALCFGCARTESAAEPPAESEQTVAPAARIDTPPSTDDLASLATGAVVLTGGWQLFDENARSGWTTRAGRGSQPAVVELADRGIVRAIAVDVANVEHEGRIPRVLLVEMSDKSATSGFAPIASIALPRERKDGLTFAATREVPGRWLRVSVKKTYSGNVAEVMEVRALGERLTHEANAPLTGSYQTSRGALQLTQNGNVVTGCEQRGALDGRLLTFLWRGKPAVATVSASGRILGGSWSSPEKMEPFDGRRVSATPKPCRTAVASLADELRAAGRAIVYGIHFDPESAALREESKPVLASIAEMLHAAPELRITIEDHSDTTLHDAHVSHARASAVMARLAGAGIDAARMQAAGMAATKPLASNDSPLGRAVNRRVELVRQ
ncbi:MAG TPA: OmpA family protein [Thermoanaerobaculia bacterium]|nr:OmpA family protein [Thermoanaerobaculia bacterium]